MLGHTDVGRKKLGIHEDFSLFLQEYAIMLVNK